jgi:hypothetical protein
MQTVAGFSDDGSSWSLTSTFHDATVIESGESRGPDGKPVACRTTWEFSKDRLAL